MSLRGAVRIVVLLAVMLVAARFWALAYIDKSTIARSMMWFAADADDWKKVPARSFDASRRPLPLPSPDQPNPIVAQQHINTVPLPGFLASNDTTAFLVARGEHLIYEAYFNGASRDAIQTSFSLAKAFTSTLIGIAINDSYLDLDDAVSTYLPEFGQRDPRFNAISLRHLLTMASGLRYRERGLPWSDDAVAYYAPDLRQAAMQVTYETVPGLQFHSNNFNPLLLGMVLERATGMEVAEYLGTRLWQPMGAEAPGSWSLDSKASGFEKMASGLNGRAVDFLKLGILYAQDGQIYGQQVLSPAWVAEATRADTSLDPALNHQFYWWVFPNNGTIAALGNQGQIIYVDPAADLVILRMGNSDGGIDRLKWVDVLDQVARSLTNG